MIRIVLVRIRNYRAIVGAIGNNVAVRIGVRRVGARDNLVDIEHSVVVVVGIRIVADAVAVRIHRLVRVVRERIFVVRHTITVRVILW